MDTRQFKKFLPINHSQWVGDNEQRIWSLAHHLRKDTIEIVWLSNRRSLHHDSQCLRRSLQLPEFKGHAKICRIPKDGAPGELGKDFLQKFEPFPTQLSF